MVEATVVTVGIVVVGNRLPTGHRLDTAPALAAAVFVHPRRSGRPELRKKCPLFPKSLFRWPPPGSILRTNIS
jgi:hypothetical protein